MPAVNDASILTEIKSALGLAADYTDFDTEIKMHINAVLGDVTQLGVGPTEGFEIEDSSEKWSDLLGTEPRLNPTKAYIYNRVRLLFDPPQVGFVLTAIKQQIEELSWRMSVAVDEINRENEVLP